jgi:nicotinate-nucleotide--dimethylbenzimidazole phosphoribosyltransferase
MVARDDFDDEEKRGVYRAIHTRRDVRSYRPDPVDDSVLARVLEAAHHAPSVGFMQPWTFVLVRAPEAKRAMYDHFLEVNERAARVHPDARGETYRSLKLQGLLDAPVHVLVVCDPERAGEHVLGRFTMPETDVYSTCLAVQNLWLAARAEGLGVGWMSLFEPPFVKAFFGLPERVVPVAYLTLGHPVVLPDEPLLERVGWAKRRPLSEVVREGRWDGASFAGVLSSDVPAPTRKGLSSDAAHARLDALTKPVGSLGRLETLGAQLASIACGAPKCERPALFLFAADHGLTVHGVSAYRSEATRQMVYQFLAEGAVVNAFARQQGVAVHVIDVGVDHDFGEATGLHREKVRRGTRDVLVEAAMSHDELARAIEVGARMFDEVRPDVLLVGEMGIGNTTSSAMIFASLLGLTGADVVGRGTGISDPALERKRAVIDGALARHGTRDATEALRTMGGLEIAALVGAIEAAASAGVPIILDGFITTVAAWVAVQRNPSVARFLIASHVGAERAHRRVLDALGLEALLDLGLRLGEGSGAVLAMPLVRAAASLFEDVRTFEEANIVRPLDPRG